MKRYIPFLVILVATGCGLIADSFSGGGGSSASGAVTQISKQTLLATAASITFSSIPSTYNNLQVYLIGRTNNAVADQDVYVQANGDSGTNYDRQFLAGSSTTPTSGQTISAAQAAPCTIVGTSAAAGEAGICLFTLFNYTGTSFFKNGVSSGGRNNGSGSGNVNTVWWDWRSTAAITSLTLAPTAGSFDVGTVAILYGIN